MGFPKKPPVVDGGLDLDGSKRWCHCRDSIKSSLKPISTNPVKKEIDDGDGGGDDEDEQNNYATTSTTPTSEEARIPSRLVCPRLPGSEKLLSSVIIAVVLGSSSLLLTWKPFLFKRAN
ncbi:cyclin-dependent protein kinase inhibitor SMR [Salix suchowensis]|nr:cyclin-dependent protein kinase inhibitor SMR [Salix suchowensis]